MKRTPVKQLCALAALSVNAPCCEAVCVHMCRYALTLAPYLSWAFVFGKTWRCKWESRIKGYEKDSFI